MNPRIAAIAALLPLTVGCRAFDWEEAELIAKGNTKTTVAVYKSAYDDWQASKRRATDATLEWTETDTGFAASGTLTSDGPVWTGSMGFEGSIFVEDDLAGWDLAIGYDQVSYDGVVVDGDMAWGWDVEVYDDGFHMEYTVQGEITATGDEVDGTGEMDYTAILDVQGTSVSMDADGKIGGTPIDFSLTVNVPL